MNFKNDIGTGFDELALAGMEYFGGLARSITDEKIARQRTGVRFFVNFRRRSHKKDAFLLVLEVIRSGFAEVSDDVVNDRAVRWPNFEHLHPFVFGKTGRHNYVLIVDHSRSRDRERLWQLKYDVWRGYAPSLDKIFYWRRHVFLSTFLRACIDPGHQGSD